MSSKNDRAWNEDDEDDEEDEDNREFNEELQQSSPKQNVVMYKREESIGKRQETMSNANKMTVLQQNQHRDLHRHHHRKIIKDGGHVKEFIKPDPTVRRLITHKTIRTDENQQDNDTGNQEVPKATQPLRVVTVVDEEQLHKRLVESSSKNKRDKQNKPDQIRSKSPETSNERSVSNSASSSSSANSIDRHKSPLPTKILIPPEVVKSLSKQDRDKSTEPVVNVQTRGSQSSSSVSGKFNPIAPQDPPAKITKEQLEYGPFLKHDEVQVLYRSPEAAESVLGVLRSLR